MVPPDVLVVDDDLATRDALLEVLRLEGYDVSVAADGREAWESLQSAPPPALILLDLMMPTVNGAEFLERLHADARLKTLPVILMTAFGFTALAYGTQSQGFLPKPLDLDQLIGLVSRYCPAKPGEPRTGEGSSPFPSP